MSNETLDKLNKILRHIQKVQENCIYLGEKLIQNGEIELGRKLIRNGLHHDNSKLTGIEWDHLSNPESEGFKLALAQHQKTNLHHPEAWEKIQDMPRVYLAEFVCDVSSRAEEFGSSVEEWLTEKATKKFSFTKREKVWKDIKFFLSLLLDQPFKQSNVDKNN